MMRPVAVGRIVAILTLSAAVLASGYLATAQTRPAHEAPRRLPLVAPSERPRPSQAEREANALERPIRLPPPAPRVALAPTNRLPPLDSPQPAQPPEPVEAPPLAPPVLDAPHSIDTESRSWEATLAEPWWCDELAHPLRPDGQAVPVTVDALVVAALENSEHVRAIQQAPLVWQEDITIEEAAFDVAAFIDARWRDISEPVGNTLTTGGPPRFQEHDWRTTGGFRRRTVYGGVWELSQRTGLQDTNSLFFVPQNQAQTRFSLSFSQPLLRNRGRAYNQGLVVIAETNAGIAHHTAAQRLQDHLLATAKAYWRLVLFRELAAQRRRHILRAEEVFVELERRRDLDLLRNQSLRAEAAIATRKAALARAETEVRNAETEIARLTGGAFGNASASVELIPAEPLTVECGLPEIAPALEAALAQRPEVAAAMERTRQAEVRLAMARNELMPALNLVLESYLMGLEGDYGVSDSLREQFTDGAPSYTAGLIFEMPLGNRAAKASHRRRQHEAAQVMHELNAVLADTRAEVETAVRNAHAAWRELTAKAQALTATEAELNYLHARWKALHGVDGNASFLLTDVLDAQDRLVQAEAELSHARYAWAVSLLELKKATGELMTIK